jgi:uncharacterized protein (TIGR04255 family)
MENSQANGVWRPAHEVHAIERVTASFFFQEPLSSKPWQTLINSASSSLPSLGFNAMVEVPELPLPPNQTVVLAPHSPWPGGRIFQSLQGSQVHEEIGVFKNLLSYTATRYNRWGNFQERLFLLISPLLKVALNTIDINAIKLEYWDRFIFEGPKEEVSYSELFIRTSSFLPVFTSSSRELWHSHVGFFVPAEANKRLININVDILDIADPGGEGQTKRSAAIYLMAQDTFAESPPQDRISTALNGMHTSLKDVFNDLISPSMASRISLNKPE